MVTLKASPDALIRFYARRNAFLSVFSKSNVEERQNVLPFGLDFADF